MLQIRERAGDGDKRWYSPQRDICYAFPRTLRKSLEAFNEFEGNAKVSLADLGQGCKVLGQIVQGCREGGVSPEQVLEKLDTVPQPVLDMLGTSFLYTFFAELVVWCSEVRPREGENQDVPIDVSKLEEILELFARSAAPDQGGGDVQAAQ